MKITVTSAFGEKAMQNIARVTNGKIIGNEIVLCEGESIAEIDNLLANEECAFDGITRCKISVELVEYLRQEELNDCLARKIEHEQLKLVLAAFDGKRLTSRSKIAPFELNRDGSIYGKYRHFFTNPVDVRKQDYTNRCNYNVERIKRLEKLNVEKVAEIFAKIQEGFDMMLDGFWDVYMQNIEPYNNPLYYDLTRLIEGKDSDKDINLSRFYAFRRPRE